MLHRSAALRAWRQAAEAKLPKRAARQTPLWHQLKLVVGFGIAGAVLTTVFFFGRRIYHNNFKQTNDLYIVSEVCERMKKHPELCAAMTRITMHHALSNVDVPFGSPLCVPIELAGEALEVYKLLEDIKEDYPEVAMADLWVLASSNAIKGVGGPVTSARWGRSAETDTEHPFMITKPVVPDNKKDIVAWKKHFMELGYSYDEMVALIGGRTVGYHLSDWGNTSCWRKKHFVPKKVKPEDAEKMAKVGMEAIDMSLLDDAMALGWVNKFAENELRFYKSFGAAVDRIHLDGWLSASLSKNS